MVVDSSNFLICYASQKGTAKSIAEDISEQSIELGLYAACHLMCISELTSINDLKQYSCIVFIGSTTGDGDAPDTAQKFMRNLKSLEGSLFWLHYTILGLGDTNYTNFCNFGKTLDKRLQNAKAHRFYDCGWADDGTGLEIVVEPWIEGLFPSLKQFFLSTPHRKNISMESNNENIKVIGSKPYSEESQDKDWRELTLPVFNQESTESTEELAALFPSLHLPQGEDAVNFPVKKCLFGSETKFSIPTLPSPFIVVKFNEGTKIDRNEWNKIKTDISYPLSCSEVIPCHIEKCHRMTTNEAVKKALELHLKPCSGEPFEYEPGDSFGILVENVEDEVNLLLRRLKITDVADMEIKLSVDPLTQKKAASIPKFIPHNCTLRYIFTHCLDIRSIPKKPFLRALVEYTHDPSEQRRLTELVSKEGNEEYNKVVRSQGLTFLDLLLFFPSCYPPISLLLEHLQRLLPRPYSITSSPLLTPDSLSFVFNVVEIPKGESIFFERKGLCTGMLDSKTKCFQRTTKTQESPDSLSSEMDKLGLGEKEKVLIYFRSNKTFRLPKEVNTPLLMVGPGTGVAPFIGFLKHREAQLKANTSSNVPFTWLFFGCRHKDRDFLYEDELQRLKEAQVLTRLSLSFSRDESTDCSPKYVQDSLVLQGEGIVDYIHNHQASIYVCGDAKNMSKNVLDTFTALLQKHLEMTEMEARKYVAQLQMNQRYLQDVWA